MSMSASSGLLAVRADLILLVESVCCAQEGNPAALSCEMTLSAVLQMKVQNGFPNRPETTLKQ